MKLNVGDTFLNGDIHIVYLRSEMDYCWEDKTEEERHWFVCPNFDNYEVGIMDSQLEVFINDKGLTKV